MTTAQTPAGQGPGGELTAAAHLLAGLVVTGDALFAQRELCAQITKKGAATS